MVLGSRRTPYTVQISINKIAKYNWKSIKDECQGKIESLQELLQGQFPKALAETFTTKNHGLFPSPQEINFSCSCPDWASMCKHVAAVLFGIGTRLDDDPMLFFKLRGVDGNDLVAQAVKDNTNKLLEKAKKKSKRVLDNIDISDVFGIDMDSESPAKPHTKKETTPTPKQRKAKQPKKKTIIPKKPKKTPQSRKKHSKGNELDIILKTIKRSRKGIDISSLQEKTGIENKQRIYNCIYGLLEKGEIKRVSRGIYKGT